METRIPVCAGASLRRRWRHRAMPSFSKVWATVSVMAIGTGLDNCHHLLAVSPYCLEVVPQGSEINLGPRAGWAWELHSPSKLGEDGRLGKPATNPRPRHRSRRPDSGQGCSRRC